MNIISTKKVASALATSALLMNAFASTAFASTTVEVSGNSDSSNNSANVTNNQSTTVVQSNSAYITNTVNSSANSGNNNANRNTGGDVMIDTGNATSITNVSTAANLNLADLSNCNCENDTKVVIAGNGVDSTNRADVSNSRKSGTEVFQDNNAYIDNYVMSDANSGYNRANSNTGGTGWNSNGDVTITTGAAVAETNVHNLANANVATVGGNGDGGVDTALILLNGDSSQNTIRLKNNHSTTIVQDNSAHIWNGVSADANSGDNEANRNTGANVTIDTGLAAALVSVDNAVNFNKAVVDCDCVLGGETAVKIAGNGVDSRNRVYDTQNGGLEVFQGGREGTGNYAWLWNDAYADADSGDNNAKSNTGRVYGIDPVVIFTGNAVNQTDVNNAGNVNIFSNGDEHHSPLPHPSDFVFDFDMGGLWGWWNGA